MGFVPLSVRIFFIKSLDIHPNSEIGMRCQNILYLEFTVDNLHGSNIFLTCTM